MTLEVNKDYVFKSAFTGEEFTASYRGEAQDGNIVVWTSRTQLTIPRGWAIREYKAEPDFDKYYDTEDDSLWAKGIRRGEQYAAIDISKLPTKTIVEIKPYKSKMQLMVEWLDNRDRHSGKMRKAELRYIRTKAHELLVDEKAGR